MVLDTYPEQKGWVSAGLRQSSAGREKTNQPNTPQPNNKQMQKQNKQLPWETKSLNWRASDTQNNLCSFYNVTLILEQLKLYTSEVTREILWALGSIGSWVTAEDFCAHSLWQPAQKSEVHESA